MIITIDGAVATGKTTIAAKLADSLGFIFFDTGAIYRLLTYAIFKHEIEIQNQAQLREFLKNFRLDIKVQKQDRQYLYEEEDVTQAIRRNEVSNRVSEIAAVKEIRDKVTILVRKLSHGINAVFEGRDMGTVVFPDAELKIFLTGRDEVRAKRRYDELINKFPTEVGNFTLDRCLQELKERDRYDSTREYAPLIQSEDSFVIDTSEVSIEEAVFKILEYKDAIKSKKPFSL